MVFDNAAPILLLGLPEEHKFDLMVVPRSSIDFPDDFHNWPNYVFTPEERENWYKFRSLINKAGRGGHPPTILTLTQTLQSLLK